jgi:hypothetical protein
MTGQPGRDATASVTMSRTRINQCAGFETINDFFEPA